MSTALVTTNHHVPKNSRQEQWSVEKAEDARKTIAG